MNKDSILNVPGIKVFVPVVMRKGATPLVFLPGFGAGPHEKFVEAVANMQECMAYFITWDDFRPTNVGYVEGFFGNSAQNERLVYYRKKLRSIINHHHSQVDLIGYSEGAMHAIMQAYEDHNGHEVRNLYLVNPAGITGKESSLRIIFRAFCNLFDQRMIKWFEKDQEVQERILHFTQGIAKYMKLRGRAGIPESMEPGKVDLRLHLEDVLECRRHDVTIFACKGDSMIPIKVLTNRYADDFRIEFIAMNGTHQKILVDPELVARKLFIK